jgi:hypothetical protein
MGNKLLAIKILAALGIPLFPLGARLYLSQASAPAPREAAAQGGVPPAAFEPERLGEPGRPPGEALPPVEAEALARVFRAPGKAAPGDGSRERAQERAQERAGEEGPGGQSLPVPGEGKFSYLGSIRESGGREWLYIKEEASGRIISVDALLSSTTAERCVVEIEGISYSIRRN